MKTPAPQSAFTVIELLVVLGLMVALVFLLIPRFSRVNTGNMSPNISCMVNQKQINLGFMLSQQENDGKFPWQLSITTNGTMELITNGHASSQFQALTYYVKSFAVYICPTDINRQPAANYESFTDTNTSYFVNVDAATNNSSTILTGDRHLVANGNPVKPGLFFYKSSPEMGWTRELHGKNQAAPCGSLGFADGHSEIVTSKNLNAVFQRQGLVSDRLEIP